MSKDMETMEVIQKEKEREVKAEGLKPLDAEGVTVAETKLWAIDDIPVMPVDPLR